jgi:hypothetical protein
MQHQWGGEFIQQARRHDHIGRVTRVPNRAVDVVSRPQTPILWAEPIERSILDGCDWLRRKRFQSKLSGRPSSGFHSPYSDRPIGVGAVFHVARIYPHNRMDRTLSCEPSTDIQKQIYGREPRLRRTAAFERSKSGIPSLNLGRFFLPFALFRCFPHLRSPLRWIMRLMG